MLLLGFRAQCIQFRNEDLLLQTGRKYVHIWDFMCLGFMVLMKGPLSAELFFLE